MSDAPFRIGCILGATLVVTTFSAAQVLLGMRWLHGSQAGKSECGEKIVKSPLGFAE
jgi:hypothetical protein